MKLILLAIALYLACEQVTPAKLPASAPANASIAQIHQLSATVTEVCYEGFGCYNNGPPYGGVASRPTEFLPMSPEQINLFFTHYKRSLMGGAPIDVGNTKNFDPSLPTTIVCHGWTQSNSANWMLAIKNNTLSLGDANIILTNWDMGALQLYGQSTMNTRVVATGIARLINDLIKNAGAKIEDIHLIGHSMGGQIVGMVGSQVKNIPRITALDPAGKMFFDADPIVRLDPTDAQFVVVIHTDILGLGYPGNIGHIDIYPNGGINQPQCTDSQEKIQQLFDQQPSADVLGCSHMYSCHIFADTILSGGTDCQYDAYQCDTYENFKRGNCFSCPDGGCNKMGYYTSSTIQNGTFYLDTLAFPGYSDFCLNSYLVTLNSSIYSHLAAGDFNIYFQTSNGTQYGTLADGRTLFYAGASQTRVASIPPLHGANVDGIKISYERLSSNNAILDSVYGYVLDSKYSFDSVSIRNNTGGGANYCTNGADIATTGTEYMYFLEC